MFLKKIENMLIYFNYKILFKIQNSNILNDYIYKNKLKTHNLIYIDLN
jgi:hypothetical protein